jgi:hypothetical protein
LEQSAEFSGHISAKPIDKITEGFKHGGNPLFKPKKFKN